jgi:methylmalonyl-CoA mutase cobalamin-binding subunit
MGGAAYDPTAQAAQQAEMLAKAVGWGVITQAEADLFATVHDAVEKYRAEHPEVVNGYGNATKHETVILSALIGAQIITQEQADAFQDIHDRLGASGLTQ